MKIWSYGNSQRSGSRNAWTRIKIVNGASRLRKFWNFFRCHLNYFQLGEIGDHGRNLVMSVWSRNKAMEWRHSGSPRPKIFRVQKSAGKFLVSIFWDQDGIILIDTFQRAKQPSRSITHLCWCNWRNFVGKTQREVHQGGLILARQCPGSPGNCNPEETGLPGLPVSWSPTLFSRSGPFGLPPVPWTEKTIERSIFFFRRWDHCCRGDLGGRTAFWIFF